MLALEAMAILILGVYGLCVLFPRASSCSKSQDCILKRSY